MKKKFLIKLIAGLLLLFGGGLSAQSKWQVLPGEMPFPAGGCKAVVKDTLIYVIGGYSDSTNSNLDIIQVYSPARNAWLPSIKMNSKRSGFIADNYGDGIVILGGIDSLNLNASGLEYFDPRLPSASKMWEKDINFNRMFASGKVHGNSFYIFGGNTLGTEGDLNRRPFMIEFNLKYRLIMDSTNAIFTSGIPIYQQMCALINDDIYLLGGVMNAISSKIYKYNTVNKTFANITPSLLSVRAGGEAVTDGNRIFIIGGFNETQKSLASVEIFTPGNGNIAQGAQLNTARKNPAAVFYNGRIYVFGGFNSFNQTLGTVEKYEVTTTSAAEKNTIPGSFVLYDNYPNPFNAGTQIKFSMPEMSRVSLDIYTILGEHVATLADGSLAAGVHTYSWNGRSDNGNTLGSGMYIYRLTAGSYSFSKKMVMLK